MHDLLLNRGTVDPRSGLGGGNHPDNDEIYYGVSGTSLVDLGGHPDTGEGGETFSIGPGAVVFIPAGTFHRLRNTADEPFVLLTIGPSPQPAVRTEFTTSASMTGGRASSCARTVTGGTSWHLAGVINHRVDRST